LATNWKEYAVDFGQLAADEKAGSSCNGAADYDAANRVLRKAYSDSNPIICDPQKYRPTLRSLLFQAIVVVQPAEQGRRCDAMLGRKQVSTAAVRNLNLGRFRNPRAERHVRTAAIIEVQNSVSIDFRWRSLIGIR